MPICACKKTTDDNDFCRAPWSCAVWDDRNQFCQGCRGNRCPEHLHDKPSKTEKEASKQQTAAPHDPTPPGTWIPPLGADEPFAKKPAGNSRELNLLTVRPPGSWSGFVSYLDTMTLIALGQAKASDVLERLAVAEKQGSGVNETKQDNN